ncbi:MAG: hypothetical protein GEU71_00880 [Actinobacteria bacterium]|nr:hypothetical protein [Actinomycetota bacterium]
MSLDPGGGGFEVVPGSLIEAADRSFQLASTITEARDGFEQSTSGADASLGAVSAGPGGNQFCSAWSGAIHRLAHSQESFGFNTEAAAVRYEDADVHSMPAAPPVLPSPEDIDEAWDEACEPGILGEVPEECLMA